MQIRLAADGLTLRPAQKDDRGRLRDILAQPGVARWWGPGTADHAVDEWLDPDESVAFVIEVGAAVVGSIEYLEENDPDYRHASIDLFLDESHQGRAIGPAAIRVLARYLFEILGHHRLTIDPAVANEHAIRAYERVGFRPVGRMRDYERGADGSWHDGLLMDLLVGELR